MSLSCSKSKATCQDVEFSNESRKRRNTCSENDDEYCRLIPSLPDDLSIQILARLPRICYSKVRLVSRRWKSAVSNSEVYSLRKELGRTEEWLYVLTKGREDKLLWYALDPVYTRWQRLPPMPDIVYEEESRQGLSDLWNMVRPSLKVTGTVDGCATGVVDGCLYVLGGLYRSKTVSCVWRFDPIYNSWSEVSSMLASRAYATTGVLGKKLYVVGGADQGLGGLYPLQSAEVYDPSTDAWSEVPSMPFSKVQVLPNDFLADLLKPVATGMTCYNGRLCVLQSLYSWNDLLEPFHIDVGGEVYDPKTNLWVEMPSGMGEGWPASQAGTKLSVVVGGELYAFDPFSKENGEIKVYDHKEDTWKVVIGEVPIYYLTDSESRFLLAGFHGKLHFVIRDTNHNITVLRADVPNISASSSSSSSSSNSVLGSRSLCEKAKAPNKSDTVIWKFFRKDLGAAELVSCQVIDI